MKNNPLRFFYALNIQPSFYWVMFFCFLFSQNTLAQSDDPFITTWNTMNNGTSCSSCIAIPTYPEETYNYSVDWNNDGVFDQLGITGDITHDFGTPGTYSIRIRGIFPGIYFNSDGDREKLMSVDQWGDINWSSMNWAFAGCTNLTVLATDIPDLTNVTAMSGMFYGCSVFNQDIGNWNVASVADMSYMFSGASTFNQDIGNWNVASVTDMSYMFSGASSFNQNVGIWIVSNVTNMRSVFSNANSFNQDIGNWNVSNVTNMSYLFSNATSFNQNIGSWNVANVTNMNMMFNNATAFNQDIGNWDVYKVTNMTQMFYNATGFNQSLGTWNLRFNVSLFNMLNNSGLSCENYDNTLIGWNNNPITPYGKSLGATGLNFWLATDARDNLITNKGWTITGDNFSNCNYQEIDCPLVCLSNITVSLPTYCYIVITPQMLLSGENNLCSYKIFEITHFNQVVGQAGSDGSWILDEDAVGLALTAKVGFDPDNNEYCYTTVEVLIGQCIPITPMDPFITTWKTDNPGTSCSSCINIVTKGEGYNYDVDWNNDGYYDEFGINGNATHDFGTAGTYTIRIRGSFPRIYFPIMEDNGDGTWTVFDSDPLKILSVDQWGEINWSSMRSAFEGCTYLTVLATDIPDLTNVTDMSGMFFGCSALNQDIGSWNVANVTNMNMLFNMATAFNQDIGNWDVSNVTNMSYMFSLGSNFNQDIGNWNVGNVTNMSYMFSGASTFNKDIGSWDVSNVTNMSQMFSGAGSFNQDIGGWDVSHVTNMIGMFGYTSSFNQSIGGWDVSNVTDMSGMFYSADSFNQDIGGWDVSNAIRMVHMFNNATSFNQDIGNWDVSNVTEMNDMFHDACSFNQDIGGWIVSNLTSMQDMLDNCGLSGQNYDNTLIGWAAQTLQPNVQLGAEGLNYCLCEEQRQSIIDNYGWIISGDNRDCPCSPVTLSGASGSWNTASTWNEGFVPVGCNDVVINNAPDVVTIPPGYTASAKSILNSGILNIGTGSVLNISGSSAFGIKNTGGTLINNGGINISQVGTEGIINENSSTIQNNASGVITINNPPGIGIINKNSGTTIENQGVINIHQAGVAEFENSDNAQLNNFGIINITK